MRKIAPLLAETRQLDEAWQTYLKTLEGLEARGFVDQAVGVCRDACQHLPREVSAWKRLAELEQARGRVADAVVALMEGRENFRSRKARRDALALLEQARRLDPTHFEVNLDLARLLARDGARIRARRLLDELDARSEGRELRRVRARTFRLFPSPRSAWGWVASGFSA